MVNLTETELLDFLTQFAFNPLKAYGIIVFFVMYVAVLVYLFLQFYLRNYIYPGGNNQQGRSRHTATGEDLENLKQD